MEALTSVRPVNYERPVLAGAAVPLFADERQQLVAMRLGIVTFIRKRSADGQFGHWRMSMEISETEAAATKANMGILFYLNQHHRLRDRAMFDLAIDSKLRGCDLVRMKIGDVIAGGSERAQA